VQFEVIKASPSKGGHNGSARKNNTTTSPKKALQSTMKKSPNIIFDKFVKIILRYARKK